MMEGTADLPVESVHGIDGVFSLSEMDKGVVSDLLHPLHSACNTNICFLKLHLLLVSW